MKKLIYQFCFVLLGFLVLASCSQKDDLFSGDGEVPTDVINKFKELGFNTDGIKMQGNDYLVEGDIIVTPLALSKMKDPVSVPGLNGEQYRTFNLVDQGRTIRIGSSGRISKSRA